MVWKFFFLPTKIKRGKAIPILYSIELRGAQKKIKWNVAMLHKYFPFQIANN